MKRLKLFLANVAMRRVLYPLVTPPMGIMSLAAYLRGKYDLDIRLVNQRAEGLSNEALAKAAVDFEADIVGFGTLTPSAHALAPLTRMVREGLPESLVLLGGPHISAYGAEALRYTAADAAVMGEGELSFEAILRARFEGDGDFSGIPGLIWRNKDGDVIANAGQGPIIEDLDTLPMPAYDLIDLKRYWRMQSMPPIPWRRYASLVSSRGCPYHCSWCHRVFGKRFRAHSPERIIEEIRHLQRTYGVDDFEFLDDIFNHDRKRMHGFFDLLHQNNLKLKIVFPNGIRADTLTQEDVDGLKDAGTYFASFALESGSPRIQEYTGKRLSIPRFLQGVEMAAKRGIFTNGFNMFGFPTETEAEMQETIDVACASKLHTASFFTATAFPNTGMYDLVMKTHPERLANVNYREMDFSLVTVNLSSVPDDVLFRYQRKAQRQFFGPKRICRILRDFPQPLGLLYYGPIYLSRMTKGILGGRA